MTTLALAVDADDELWTLDNLPTPEAPYVTVGDELVEVRSRFPSQIYSLTGQALPPKIRVRRGIAGTTKASHIQGSTLTPNYGLGGGAGAGGVTVDNQSDPPEPVDTLVMGAAFGPAGTATVTGISDDDSVTGASATVTVEASEDDGTAEVAAQALASLDKDGTVTVSASTDEGAALVQNKATSASGTASARLDAESTSGDSEARVAVVAVGGTPILVGIVASHVDGVGDSLVITDGTGADGSDVPGQALISDATVGSKWAVLDPLTSAGAIVISADGGNAVVTLGADGSVTLTGIGGSAVTIAADGSIELAGSGVVRILFLPTADPVAAGALWNDAGTLKVSTG